MAGSNVRGAVGFVTAVSLFLSSTAVAAASPVPARPQVSPWATLTFLSGGASAAAVCGVAAGVAAAQPATGCVLPVVDVTPAPVPPPVPVASMPPPPYAISPLLAGLLAIAAGIGLFLLVKDHNHHANSPG